MSAYAHSYESSTLTVTPSRGEKFMKSPAFGGVRLKIPPEAGVRGM